MELKNTDKNEYSRSKAKTKTTSKSIAAAYHLENTEETERSEDSGTAILESPSFIIHAASANKENEKSESRVSQETDVSIKPSAAISNKGNNPVQVNQGTKAQSEEIEEETIESQIVELAFTEAPSEEGQDDDDGTNSIGAGTGGDVGEDKPNNSKLDYAKLDEDFTINRFSDLDFFVKAGYSKLNLPNEQFSFDDYFGAPSGQEKNESASSVSNVDKDDLIDESPHEHIISKMEASFGMSLSDVKIHENSADALKNNALAFTKGNNIFFAPGQYNPTSKEGQKLLGHELTHVVQQKQGRVKPTSKLNNGVIVNYNPEGSLEDVVNAEEDEIRLENYIVQPLFTVYANNPSEFVSQLKQQEIGLNEMTVTKWIVNREEFVRDGRKPDDLSKLRERIRADIATAYIQENALDFAAQNLTPEEIDSKAQAHAKTILTSNHAVLHNPDQVAGGDHLLNELYSDNDITDATSLEGSKLIGHRGTNSSLGSQWSKGRAANLYTNTIGQFEKLTENQKKKVKMNVTLKHS